jgi:hypothetical protein
MPSFLLALIKSIGVWPPDEGKPMKPWMMSTFFVLWFAVIVLGVHLAFDKGYGLGVIELTPVARAEEVDEKIAQAVEPIKEQVQVVDDRTVAILRLQYAPIIREQIRARCGEQDAERKEKINQYIDSLLKQFKSDTGQDYGRTPTCDEV